MVAFDVRLLTGRCAASSSRPDFECFDDGLGDFVLHRKDIRHLTVEAIGPELRSVRGVDELRRDADSIACPPHAPFEDCEHVERFRDSSDVLILASEREGGGTGDDAQPGDASQRVEDFLREAVAEVFVFLVRAEVGERQDSDRRMNLGDLGGAQLKGFPYRRSWSEIAPPAPSGGNGARCDPVRAAPAAAAARRATPH